MPQNMRGVRANDLIPGRNERIPVYIDGFRRPKFEKKNNYARAESGFCITYSERSQIRRRVLRSVLAETAREHVSRAMSETSASCSLVTHVCLCAFPVRFFGACEENFLSVFCVVLCQNFVLVGILLLRSGERLI